jgi:hypothetical protein
VRFDDAHSVTVVEADRVVGFGTTLGGFTVLTASDNLFFECPAAEARAQTERLWGILAVV